MVAISRRLISQVAASAAALVVASGATPGFVNAAHVLPGVQAAVPSTSSTAMHGSERAGVARPVPSTAAGRHDVEPDVLHHWFP